MEKKRNNKKIYMISGIIVLIIAIIIGIIIMNLNNNEKYLEVAKRVLPIMEEDYLDTQSIYNDLLEELLSYRYYMSKEEATNTVKDNYSYKAFVLAIEKHLSEQYKDLEYLKKHTYTKNKELSNQIKEIVNEYETEMNRFKNLDSHYEYEEESFFDRIREVQNSLNKEY